MEVWGCDVKKKEVLICWQVVKHNCNRGISLLHFFNHNIPNYLLSQAFKNKKLQAIRISGFRFTIYMIIDLHDTEM